MSSRPMSLYERTQRRAARHFGAKARRCIELAQPWNRTGDRFVDEAGRWATLAARHADIALRARQRQRGRPPTTTMEK